MSERSYLSRMSVCGNSMKAIIQDEHEVVVSKIRGQVNLGDIIVYQKGGNLFAHRIIKIASKEKGKRFWVMGDNQKHLYYDIIDEENILGKVVGIIEGEKLIDITSKSCRMLGKLIAKQLIWSVSFYRYLPKFAKKIRFGRFQITAVIAEMLRKFLRVSRIVCWRIVTRH